MNIINYMIWYLFVFIGMVWLIVMMKNRGTMHSRKALTGYPSVSILVPAHNEEGTIGKTIKSLLKLDYPKDRREIIAINDCSGDRTGEILKEFERRGEIKLLTNRKNMGKAHSLNRAIGMARGELIACIDADSTVERGMLKKMVPHFNDPRVSCVTPALKTFRSRNLLERIQAIEYIFNIFFRKMLAILDAINVAPGVFSMYRKSVVNRLGGFDEKTLTEDMEIALKIHKAGYSIENEMSAMSYTVCPSCWRELFKQRIRWYRGAIENSIRYRCLIFNRRYGNMGFFYMPVTVLAIFAVIFVFASIIWTLSSTFLDMSLKFSLINWDIGPILAEMNMFAFLYPDVFELICTRNVLLLVGFSIAVYLIYLSFRSIGEGCGRYRFTYIPYLVVYPLMTMCFWSIAMLCEVFRVKRKW